MMTVRRYKKAWEELWNTFVAASANGTFLLDRRYMEYHKDRFPDHSLLLFDDKKLVALFPAHEKGSAVYSHGGLTYGGLIVSPAMTLLPALSCFYVLTKYYFRNGFQTLLYKPVPSYFHRTRFEADMYALFLLGATVTAVNTEFVVDPSRTPHISARRKRMTAKAKANALRVVKAHNCRAFWQDILVPRLFTRFGASPVHSCGEIELLRKRFPDNIIQYNVYKNTTLLAGATVFQDAGVARAQYIAANDEGRKTGALDYLFWYFMMREFTHMSFISLGSTNMGSPDGRMLSKGLVRWKEEFGARMTPHLSYMINTERYTALREYHE